MVVWLLNSELEGIWKESVLALFEVLSWNYPAGLGKARNTCQATRSPDLNPGPLEYKSGLLTTGLRVGAWAGKECTNVLWQAYDGTCPATLVQDVDYYSAAVAMRNLRSLFGRVIIEGMCCSLHGDNSYFDQQLVLVSYKLGTVWTT